MRNEKYMKTTNSNNHIAELLAVNDAPARDQTERKCKELLMEGRIVTGFVLTSTSNDNEAKKVIVDCSAVRWYEGDKFFAMMQDQSVEQLHPLPKRWFVSTRMMRRTDETGTPHGSFGPFRFKFTAAVYLAFLIFACGGSMLGARIICLPSENQRKYPSI